MGCVGMSLDDFDHCTPSEFNAIAEQWRSNQRRLSIEGWDQARTIAVSVLQPYSKKPLKLTDICVLSFDQGRLEGGHTVPKGHGDLKRMKELERLVNATNK